MEVIKVTGGVSIFSGLAHGYSTINMINFDKYGLFHSGQLGDVTIGSYIKEKTHNKFICPDKYASALFINKLPKEFSLDYENQEQFLYLNRGLNGVLTGNIPTQQYTETISPFLDIDFLNFCLKIPIKFRRHHKIYRKWVMKKYPQAAQFKWESINAKLNEPRIIFRRKYIPIKRFPEFAIKNILLKLGVSNLKTGNNSFHMNPFGYWYRTMPEVREYFCNYFASEINLIYDNELRGDCIKMFKEGNVTEKMQVLTLLSAYKQIFRNEKNA